MTRDPFFFKCFSKSIQTLAIIFLLLPTDIFSGAWTVPKQNFRFELNSKYYYANSDYDTAWKVCPKDKKGTYGEFAFEAKMEYGFTDKINILASVPFKVVQYSDTNGILHNNGFGDLIVGTKYRFVETPFVFSGTLKGIFSGLYNKKDDLPTGKGQNSAQLGFAIGKSFNKFYAGAELSYRNLFNSSMHAIPYFVEAGYKPNQYILLRITADGQIGIPKQNESYTKIDGGIIFSFGSIQNDPSRPGVANIELGGGRNIIGSNTSLGKEGIISLSYASSIGKKKIQPSVLNFPLKENKDLSGTLPFDMLDNKNDWQVQDRNEDNGFKSVRNQEEVLLVDADFSCSKNSDCSKNGEIFLDLRFVSDLMNTIPIDLSKATINFNVKIPENIKFKGSAAGLQVFVKDAADLSQYGQWINVYTGGNYSISHSPTSNETNAAFTAKGFNPLAITVIGLKLGLPQNYKKTYSGQISIENITVSPALAYQPQSAPRLRDIGISHLIQEPVTVKDKKLFLKDKNWYVVGANWRGLQYGQNFGTNAWYPDGNGFSKHQGYVRTELAKASKAGIQAIRVFLADDGRNLFDSSGNVTGYNQRFREDVKALLSIALEQKVKINFALLDFLIDSKPRWFNHVLCGGRGMVFTDSTLRDQFMKSFLMPFLLEFGNHPAILAFNIINEPEWMIDTAEGGDIQSSNRNSEIKLDPIPLRSYKQFVTMCIDTIHIYAPAKLVTVGTSIKFHSLVDSLNVDYFAFHYYTWMDDANGCQLDCVLKSLSYTNKPWILEEFPTVSSEINSLSVYTYFRTVAENGGAGAFLWNWKPGVDNQTYNKNEREDIVRGISSWVNEAGLSGEINE